MEDYSGRRQPQHPLVIASTGAHLHLESCVARVDRSAASSTFASFVLLQSARQTGSENRVKFCFGHCQFDTDERRLRQ